MIILLHEKNNSTQIANKRRTEICFFIPPPPFWFYYTTVFGVFQYSRGENSVCAKRNIIGRKPTSLRSTSFARSATSFCVRFADNDVLALLEMMLTFGQMMLCPADINEKNHRDCDGFFGGATRNRTGDEGVADLCLTAWLWRLIIYSPRNYSRGVGADYGARTRHLDLGKVALYQMS